jgi:hypothetical protein
MKKLLVVTILLGAANADAQTYNPVPTVPAGNGYGYMAPQPGNGQDMSPQKLGPYGNTVPEWGQNRKMFGGF